MIILVLGLVLWIAAHSFKRLLPAVAEGMPDGRRKGLVSLASAAAIVLMVVGYRSWSAPIAYAPPSWGVHLNNLLMLLSIYMFAASGMKTRAARVIRHPMLTGTLLWSAAHLLANGDWAAIVLFGGIGLWAILLMIVETAQDDWTAPPPAPRGKEIGAIVGSVLLVGVIGYLHTLFGLMPFGG